MCVFKLFNLWSGVLVLKTLSQSNKKITLNIFKETMSSSVQKRKYPGSSNDQPPKPKVLVPNHYYSNRNGTPGIVCNTPNPSY